MKIRTVSAGVLLVAAGAVPAVAADAERPLCHLNDGGDWSYVADHYDDAREGGHVMDRMANNDGTCTWPKQSVVVQERKESTRIVVHTKTVTRKCVVVKRPGPNKRTCVRTVKWSGR